ncbi:MAG: hypothetical protein M1142_04765 [Patescibacteria group bacterium]|nr:hypothetical protein [Patescibacteria group bacterium]
MDQNNNNSSGFSANPDPNTLPSTPAVDNPPQVQGDAAVATSTWPSIQNPTPLAGDLGGVQANQAPMTGVPNFDNPKPETSFSPDSAGLGQQPSFGSAPAPSWSPQPEPTTPDFSSANQPPADQGVDQPVLDAAPAPVPTFTPPDQDNAGLQPNNFGTDTALNSSNASFSSQSGNGAPEAAPTDLSHLVDTSSAQAEVSSAMPQPESLVVPPVSSASQATEANPVVVGGKAPGFPKWLFLLGGIIILGVIAASAYFILGVGKSSLPFGLSSQTPVPTPTDQSSAAGTQPRAFVPDNSNIAVTPTVPVTLGTIQGGTSSGVNPLITTVPSSSSGSSALELIKLRQQGQ